MSLLHNEDFLIYQLRTAYLQQMNDGVGERLINVNTAFLNDPSFKAAGWNPNPPELKRCYSPPIPTSGASDYFKAPVRPVRLGESLDEDEEEGGMVTGRPSNDTVAPTAAARRRRRRENTDDDDDSSDLSDESIDGAEAPAAKVTNSVKFAKMPERPRSGSSPLRETSTDGGPSFTITSPSKPPDGQGLDRPSLANLDTLRTRPRRDTTTSSEISSENDLDPSFFKRKPISARAAAAQKRLINDQIAEESSEDKGGDAELSTAETADKTEDETESDDLASDFSEDIAGDSFIQDERPNDQIGLSSIARADTSINKPQLRRSQPAPDVLNPLPPPRPISVLQPDVRLHPQQ